MGGGVLGALSGLTSGNWVPFNLQQPRIQQWNATVERELGWRTALRVSYLGSYMSGLISGVDYNLIPPSDKPFGTTTGDGVTACSPDDGDCAYSPADLARLPFPQLGSYLTSFGNFGHGRTHAFQTEVNHRRQRVHVHRQLYAARPEIHRRGHRQLQPGGHGLQPVPAG